MRVEFIHYVIQELSVDKDQDFIEHGLREALFTLSNVNIWKTIVDLAGKLLQSNHLGKMILKNVWRSTELIMMLNHRWTTWLVNNFWLIQKNHGKYKNPKQGRYCHPQAETIEETIA